MADAKSVALIISGIAGFVPSPPFQTTHLLLKDWQLKKIYCNILLGETTKFSSLFKSFNRSGRKIY